MPYRLIGADGREYLSDRPGTLGGHRRNKIYGRLDCPGALRWIARGKYVRWRVFFADEATALAAGYRPCNVCMRERRRDWLRAREVCTGATLPPCPPPAAATPSPRPLRSNSPSMT